MAQQMHQTNPRGNNDTSKDNQAAHDRSAATQAHLKKFHNCDQSAGKGRSVAGVFAPVVKAVSYLNGGHGEAARPGSTHPDKGWRTTTDPGNGDIEFTLNGISVAVFLSGSKMLNAGGINITEKVGKSDNGFELVSAINGSPHTRLALERGKAVPIRGALDQALEQLRTELGANCTFQPDNERDHGVHGHVYVGSQQIFRLDDAEISLRGAHSSLGSITEEGIRRDLATEAALAMEGG